MKSQNHEVILSVKDLYMHFPIKRGVFQKTVGYVKAVDGISFDVRHGETLGLVGESGCGKTTTGRAIIQLYKPTSGKVEFWGHELTEMKSEELRKNRKHIQMIFQDPYASLNPRMTVGQIVGEPLKVHNLVEPHEIRSKVEELLQLVLLNPAFIDRYPHEFSGGQRQRIGVARALALSPKLIICDEPISALDVSVQAQIVNLLEELQDDFDLTYVFIAHDLSMVKHISDRVVVMYLGILAELANSKKLFINPLHPYTQALMSAVPIPDPKVEENRQRIILEGDVPSPIDPPSGCRFRTRCPIAEDICAEVQPEWREIKPDHYVACHLAKASRTYS
ncbi:MAG TPA: dipeptide ABC transporter ATP-binding protein [Pelolinea sp.]|nr:dipeptide ABC transporter ATP-binding protein [Pelolinea sp.]